ncbi:hypothetical protein CH063_09744, partial [Colletotrichum higginsianum]
NFGDAVGQLRLIGRGSTSAIPGFVGAMNAATRKPSKAVMKPGKPLRAAGGHDARLQMSKTKTGMR